MACNNPMCASPFAPPPLKASPILGRSSCWAKTILLNKQKRRGKYFFIVPVNQLIIFFIYYFLLSYEEYNHILNENLIDFNRDSDSVHLTNPSNASLLTLIK